jgi:hypothetical protein
MRDIRALQQVLHKIPVNAGVVQREAAWARPSGPYLRLDFFLHGVKKKLVLDGAEVLQRGQAGERYAEGLSEALHVILRVEIP